MRVLLVEDEPDAASVLAGGLREQSYAVDVAHDGDEALMQMASADYDAVLLDVMLPARDGFSVCRAIRASGCAVPILMVMKAICDHVEELQPIADFLGE